MLIPARTLAEVAKTLGGTGTIALALSAGDGMLGVSGGGRRATTRLLDAEFPRFRQLIPAEHTSAAVLEVAGLVEAIKRVALVTDRVAQVRMEFGEDGLRLAAGGDDVGSAEEELPCEFEGEPLTIAFNPGYLLDALGALHTERAQLTFTTPNRPALVRPVPAAPAATDDGAAPSPAAAGARLPAPVDARPAAGLTRSHHRTPRTQEILTCNSVSSVWARWAATCATACARPATRWSATTRGPRSPTSTRWPRWPPR